MLAALAPHLPEEHRERAYLRAIDWVTSGDVFARNASTICLLAGVLPSQLVPELLASPRGGHLYSRPEDRSRELSAIAPCLASPLREEVVSEAFALQLANAARNTYSRTRTRSRARSPISLTGIRRTLPRTWSTRLFGSPRTGRARKPSPACSPRYKEISANAFSPRPTRSPII